MITDLENANGKYDLVLFGNESADSCGYQVGIRVALKLGRPMVNGAKGLDIEGCVPLKEESNSVQFMEAGRSRRAATCAITS